MNAKENFVEISRYIGERFDLVQAGGGNTSVKLDDGNMYIKSSGYLLSEVMPEKGFSVVKLDEIVKIIDDTSRLSINDKRSIDAEAGLKMLEATIEGARPSIETFLHALMHKYTVHVHSIAINALSSQIGWKELFCNFNDKAIYVDYKTPGMELAIEMKKRLDQFEQLQGCKPNIVFLQNHGLIVSDDSIDNVYNLMEKTVLQAEEIAGVDFSKYKLTNKISTYVRGALGSQVISYMTEDIRIKELLLKNPKLFLSLPFCPDGLVYCGYEAVVVKDINNTTVLVDYVRKYHDIPKIVLYENECFILANDLKKAKLIEDVLKNNLIILENAGNKINILDKQELSYLGNWEAEKYRQKI